jgi:hypothetical protein
MMQRMGRGHMGEWTTGGIQLQRSQCWQRAVHRGVGWRTLIVSPHAAAAVSDNNDHHHGGGVSCPPFLVCPIPLDAL